MSLVNVTGACAPAFACPIRRAGDASTPATRNPDNAMRAVRMAWYCTGRFYRRLPRQQCRSIASGSRAGKLLLRSSPAAPTVA